MQENVVLVKHDEDMIIERDFSSLNLLQKKKKKNRKKEMKFSDFDFSAFLLKSDIV